MSHLGNQKHLTRCDCFKIVEKLIKMSQSSSSPHLDQISQKVRKRCVEIVHATPGGHIGGALSVTDILVSLFYSELNVKPLDPDWPMRDRFF